MGGWRTFLPLLRFSAPPGSPAPVPTPVLPSPFPYYTEYELYVAHYSRTGVLKNPFIIPLTCKYTNSITGDEKAIFVLNAASALVNDFAEFDIIEVYIRHKGKGIMDATGGFVKDFTGIVRDFEWETDDDGVTTFVIEAPEQKHLLTWRSVVYPSGTANRSTFTGVDAMTMMNTVVQYNMTAAATIANGRWREGDLAPGMGFTINVVTPLGPAGNTLSLSVFGLWVLDALRKIRDIGGGDFSFQYAGGTTFDFEFKTGQLGQDKSTGPDKVLFSLINNTMVRPQMRRVHANASVAVVAGQDTGPNRANLTVTGTDYIAGTHDIEMFVDARNQEDSGLQATGEQKLYENRTRYELGFNVMQTSDVFYSPIEVSGRKTYHIGDLVEVSYQGIEEVQQIEYATVFYKFPTRGSVLEVDIGTRTL